MSAVRSGCHEAAHALAELGLSVFAVAGKKPLTIHGLHDATRNHLTITRWWSRWPGAGVAMATGAPSGVWVLDGDGPKSAESLAELPELPETAAARTFRGTHDYFRMSDVDIRNSTSKIGPKLDVRGTGGYVVCPPSPHPDGGHYVWTRDPFNHEILLAPDWLVDLAVRQEPKTFEAPRELPEILSDRYIQAAVRAECVELARTPEGRRNDALNRAAFALARFVEAGKIDAAYVAFELASAAAAAGLAEREIRATIRSALRARGVA